MRGWQCTQRGPGAIRGVVPEAKAMEVFPFSIQGLWFSLCSQLSLQSTVSLLAGTLASVESLILVVSLSHEIKVMRKWGYM